MTCYHLIGIGGIGMSALAHLLIEKGAKVSGSDKRASAITEELAHAGVQIFIGQREENLKTPATVVYSSDIPPTNPEYKEAVRLNFPLLHRSELLRDLMQDSLPLLVTGTHGKTTTSSLLAHLLFSSGLGPSFAIGGVVRSLKKNGGYGVGDYFIAEADESDGSFLKYGGYGAIITNIDNDHLEYWRTEEALLRGFEQFAEQVTSKEHLFWCFDDDRLASLKIEGISYGFQPHADLYIYDFEQRGWSTFFDFSFFGRDYCDVELPLIGGHNVLNAAACFGLSLSLNLDEKVIREALRSFQGVKRRMEKKGEVKDIAIYDDYAHHPTEIFATLRAVKTAIGKRRLIVAFQPHRYTRTRDCAQQFSQAFEAADQLILTDIYAAGEKPIEGISIDLLLKKIRDAGYSKALYIPEAKLVEYLAQTLQPQDVLVTMGAGDITGIGAELIAHLS
jgi:UDP-N-acetylmuramate--alanine ligase